MSEFKTARKVRLIVQQVAMEMETRKYRMSFDEVICLSAEIGTSVRGTQIHVCNMYTYLYSNIFIIVKSLNQEKIFDYAPICICCIHEIFS